MFSMLKRFGRIVLLLSGVYGAALTLFLVARPPLEAANIAPAIAAAMLLHLILVPSLVLLPLHLLARPRWLALAHLVPVLMLVLYVVPRVLPREATITNGTSFTVLTHNIYSDGDMLHLPTTGVLRSADADVVALQEVKWNVDRTIGQTFAQEYPYQAYLPEPGNRLMILSRYPLSGTAEGEEPYHGWQRALLDVNGTRLALYNVHLRSPRVTQWDVSRRRAQLAALLASAASEQVPVVLAGDFNISDWTQEYGAITAHYRDSFRMAGTGFGFTMPDWTYRPQETSNPLLLGLVRPVVRIDYVFTGDGVTALEAFVWPVASASDHRALFTRLSIET
jgi:endonuclease/exonuclease/phosphatase (EEP) superfamily protein YafD